MTKRLCIFRIISIFSQNFRFLFSRNRLKRHFHEMIFPFRWKPYSRPTLTDLPQILVKELGTVKEAWFQNIKLSRYVRFPTVPQ